MSETLSASLPSDLEARITRVLQNLCDRGLTIATVESCTGGLIASVLTDVEGCGHAFERGFVTYSEAAKIKDVDVPRALIEARTAVSAEVAQAMALGGLCRSTADLASARRPSGPVSSSLGSAIGPPPPALVMSSSLSRYAITGRVRLAITGPRRLTPGSG